MIETITKYICDYCKNEVSYTEYTQGVKISIRAELAHPEGKCGQVAGRSMNICKKCSEELGIVNSEEYHMYTYSQSRLRDTIGKVKTKIVDMFYKKDQKTLQVKQDRTEAILTIYDVINSGIISDELEEDLRDIANAIQGNNWTGEIEEGF